MDWFQLTMGLHQGDPISPYLFILAVEALTRVIKREHDKALLTRLPFEGGAKHLVHLLYVDDLVERASVKEYCRLSSQKLTLLK